MPAACKYLIAFCLLVLAACETPRPFRPDKQPLAPEVVRPPDPGVNPQTSSRAELVIETPKGMSAENAARLASALAIELRNHDVVATTEAVRGLPRLSSQVTTGPFEGGAEIRVNWTIYDKDGREVDKFEHSTTGQLDDWNKGSERMISRFAYRAAPDVAIRLGKPPAPEPPEKMSWSVLPGMPAPPGEKRAPGGLPIIPDLPPVSDYPKPGDTAGAKPAAAPVAMSRFPKVRVTTATGAPGDGNTALAKAMRHSLGASRIILMDRIDPQVFTVTATVSITPPQDKKQHIVIKWTVTDPAGVLVGDLEQANDIPEGALNGPWGGLADVIAIAATDAVLELIHRARALGGGSAQQ